MPRDFAYFVVCTILTTQMSSQAGEGDDGYKRNVNKLFEFFDALRKDDVIYTTKASYEQKNSRVDCVMRTKIRSERTLVRMCMQSKINSPRPKPYTMKITYRRTKNGEGVTEGWSRDQYTLTIHYVGEACVVYSVNKYKPLTLNSRACGIWRKNIGYDVPEDDECQGNASQVCGSNWRPISSRNKCGRVPPPECKYYDDK
uniref:Putative secreted protein n=1 Tax=Ixodes ricinus TaxID=34613 RepID=A0A6B0V1Y7_IXORI